MCFSNFSDNELIVLASYVSIALSEGKSTQEISILSAFFSSLGDNLAIMALGNSRNDKN